MSIASALVWADDAGELLERPGRDVGLETALERLLERRLLDAQAVGVRRDHAQVAALGRDEDPGEDRARLVARGGPRDLGDGLDERLGRDADDRVALGVGQRREVLGPQGAQVEPRGARDDLHVLLGGAELERDVAAGKLADDVQEQARGQDGLARADDLGAKRIAQADLHVRRAELDAVAVGDDLDPGEGLDGAARRRDASDGLQLREELLGGGRQLHDEGSLEGEGVIGAVQVCTAGRRPAPCGFRVHTRAWTGPMESVRDGGRVRSVHIGAGRAQEGSDGARAGRPREVELDRRTRSWASGSAARRSATRRQAWRTVVWLRPPKAARRPGASHRVLADEEHRDLSRPGDPGGAAGRQELLALHAEGRRGQVLDPLGGRRASAPTAPAAPARAHGVEAVEHVAGQVGGRAAARSARRRPRRG